MAKFLGRTKQKMLEAMGKAKVTEDPKFEAERETFESFVKMVRDVRSQLDTYFQSVLKTSQAAKVLSDSITTAYEGESKYGANGKMAATLCKELGKQSESYHIVYTQMMGKFNELMEKVKMCQSRITVRDTARVDFDRKAATHDKKPDDAKATDAWTVAKAQYERLNPEVRHELTTFNEHRFELMNEALKLFNKGLIKYLTSGTGVRDRIKDKFAKVKAKKAGTSSSGKGEASPGKKKDGK